MLFRKLFKLLAFVLISAAAIMGAQDLLADHPRLQATIAWTMAASASALFLYLLCRETKYSLLGLNILRKLILLPTVVFVLWLINTILKLLNIIPLMMEDGWRIGNIWNEPYMSISFGAGIVMGFVMLLIIYWSEDLGVSLKLSPEIEG